MLGHAAGVGAPFFYYFGHVGGEWGVELYPFVGFGVGEAEFFGMQRLAGEDAEAVVYKLLVFGEHGAFYDAVAAIGAIAKEGVAYVLHVDTYLVGAAGLEPEFYEGYVVEPLEDFVVGDGVFAIVAIGEGVHYFAEAEVAAYVHLYGSFLCGEVAPHKGYVAAVYGVLLELGGEEAHGFFFLAYDHEAGGVFVYAVHEAYAGEVFEVHMLLLQVVAEAVHQCAGIVAAAGVHYHAGGLVHNEEVVVFVGYVEGYVFGYYFLAFGAACLEYDYGIVWPHAVV